ncbi:MAG TPA: hypothetical protein VKY31_11295 [Terriglobia bacterium]|nr:hypothetical protein [Terriglobia bacterium]
MRKAFTTVACAASLTVLLVSCAQPQPQPAPKQPEAEYRTTATVKDIMDALVDPGSDYIWDSVETVVSAKGVEEKAPKTDEDWKQVRNHAIMLLEATNLLQMPGRHVAAPGEKATDPNVELAPEQIEAAINKDRKAWIAHAHDLHDAVMKTLQAADAKDKDKLLEVGNDIDEACEKCHLVYWYPNEKRPDAAPSPRKSD